MLGIDIMPALKSEAPLPHPPIFEMGGVNLMTVRRGKWKLHVRKPQIYRPPTGTHIVNADFTFDTTTNLGLTINSSRDEICPNLSADDATNPAWNLICRFCLYRKVCSCQKACKTMQLIRGIGLEWEIRASTRPGLESTKVLELFLL